MKQSCLKSKKKKQAKFRTHQEYRVSIAKGAHNKNLSFIRYKQSQPSSSITQISTEVFSESQNKWLCSKFLKKKKNNEPKSPSLETKKRFPFQENGTFCLNLSVFASQKVENFTTKLNPLIKTSKEFTKITETQLKFEHQKG